MKKPVFQIDLPQGDEGLHIFIVNDFVVGEADHDSHGWEGMAEARRMFENISQKVLMGMPITSR